MAINTTVSAIPVKKLTLKETVELALQNSKQLKISQAKITEAGGVLAESRERRLPDLKVSGAYMYVSQPKLDLKVPLGSSQQQSGQGESGSGGSSASGIPKIDQAMYGMASLSVPVFSGFRIQHGIASAKYLKKAAEFDAHTSKDEIIINAISAFCNLYKSKSAVEIMKENLRQSQQRVADMDNLEKNGLLARNDLLKTQLQQSNIELALLDAENSQKIAYINMCLMLGLPEDTELEPVVDELTAYKDDKAFSEWEALALQNRYDLQAIDMRKKATAAGVKAAKGEYYPSLALTGGYIALNVPKFVTATNIINGGIGISYSPSSLWKTGSKVTQAKARLQQATLSQDLMNDAARLETAQSYQSYLSSIKKTDVYKKALEQAEENYKIVKNKFDNSLSTTTELLDADVALLQAKLNYSFSKTDAFIAYNKLKQTTGTLNPDELTK